MAAERLLAMKPDAPAVSTEARAERKRVMDGLGLLIDDCLKRWGPSGDPVVEGLIKGFALEIVLFSRFIRNGGTVEEFAATRGNDPTVKGQ